MLIYVFLNFCLIFLIVPVSCSEKLSGEGFLPKIERPTGTARIHVREGGNITFYCRGAKKLSWAFPDRHFSCYTDAKVNHLNEIIIEISLLKKY